MHREMMNVLCPVVLKSIQSCIESNPGYTSLQTSLEELKLLTALCDIHNNNLMIDDVIHLLVTNTSLVLSPLIYSISIPSYNDANSPLNLLLHLKQSSPQESVNESKELLILEYAPIHQLLSFDSPYWEGARDDVCVGILCYQTLMDLIRIHGSSIQKGYNDILMLVVSIFYMGMIDQKEVRYFGIPETFIPHDSTYWFPPSQLRSQFQPMDSTLLLRSVVPEELHSQSHVRSQIHNDV